MRYAFTFLVLLSLTAFGQLHRRESFQTLVNEDFEYGSGSFSTQGTGYGLLGWNSGWTNGSTLTVDASSTNMPTVYGVRQVGNWARVVASGLDTPASSRGFRYLNGFSSLSEFYLRFTVRFWGIIDTSDTAMLYLGSAAGAAITTTTFRVGIIGASSGGEVWVIRAGPGTGSLSYQVSTNQYTSGESCLIILKAWKYGTGTQFDGWSVWVNPTSTSDAPALTRELDTSQSRDINGIGFYAGNLDTGDTVFFDNIRMSKTFADCLK